MLYVTCNIAEREQYFVVDGYGNQSWSFQKEDATLFNTSGLGDLIRMIETSQDRIEIRDITGVVLHSNYEKSDRIDKFLSWIGGGTNVIKKNRKY